MSADGYLIDRMTRHQIFLQRFAGGQVKESLPILRQMAIEIRAALQRTDLTDFQTARLMVLQLDIQAITTAAGIELKELMTANMSEFAVYEAGFTTRLLQGAVTLELAGVSTVALGSAVASMPMTLVSGQKTIYTSFIQIFDIFASGVARETMTAVQAGITSGATNAEIVRNVMSLVTNRSRAQAETVVRTAANATGSMAREAVYAANDDVLDGEEWVATLDSSTRIAHAALDGNVYLVGQGPKTPLGYNCRCIRVPKVAERFAVLREGATRASYQGPVSSQRTYGGFLRDQPEGFQREFFQSDERYRLYKSGKVPLKRFADDSGRLYTIEELEAREGITLE